MSVYKCYGKICNNFAHAQAVSSRPSFLFKGQQRRYIIGIIMYYAQVWLKLEAVLIELTPRICYSILDVWNGRDV